jgi:uncharacterized protein (TIGR02453 family)
MSLNFTAKSFALLEDLVANNEKAWYDKHRDDFEACLRQPFGRVLELATECLASTPIPLEGSSKTMFRQNRDTRFSKDKSPYNTHISGLLTPSGTKTEKEVVVYVHLDSSGGFIACGFYQLKATELAAMRDYIIGEPEAFSLVLNDLEDNGLSLENDNSLTAMPRGYREYEKHLYADYLKLKSFMVKVKLNRRSWVDGNVVNCIIEQANKCASLLKFGNLAQEIVRLG